MDPRQNAIKNANKHKKCCTQNPSGAPLGIALFAGAELEKMSPLPGKILHFA